MGLRFVIFMCMLYLFVINVSTQNQKNTTVYKPVVIVHGIWDKRTSLDFMADRIRQVGFSYF